MKKGVALLWVLSLTVILMIVTSSMVSYIIKESKLSVNIEESSRAFSAAKSGIEWGKTHINQRLTENPLPSGEDPLNPIKLVLETDNSGNPTIRSDIYLNYTTKVVTSRGCIIRGSSCSVIRELEYKISDQSINKITPIQNNQIVCDNYDLITRACNQNISPLNNNNFSMQFDFWYRNIDTPFAPSTVAWPSQQGNGLLFGLQANDPGTGSRVFDNNNRLTGIGVEFKSDGKIRMIYQYRGYNLPNNANSLLKIPGSTTDDFSLKDYSDYSNTSPVNAYRVNIKIIRGSFMSVKIMRAIFDVDGRTNKFECVGYGSANLDPSNSIIPDSDPNNLLNRALMRYTNNNDSPQYISFDPSTDTIIYRYPQVPPNESSVNAIYITNVYLRDIVNLPI